MHQKRLMGELLTILIIILSLQFSWMETIENKGVIPLDGHITNEETNIIHIQLNQTFGGPERDYGSSVTQTADGGFLIAGSTESYGEGDLDMWSVKTNTNGFVEWNQTRDIFGSDRVSDFIPTEDGGFLLVGTSTYESMLPVISTGSALKLFANGTEEWCQSYYYERSEWFSDEHCFITSVIQTADGGFLLAGETVDYYVGGSGPLNMDMWLVKTDVNGSVEWNQIYGSRDDSGYSVIQTTDGGFLIAGSTETYGADDEDIWLVKTYVNGSVEWEQTYGGSVREYAVEVIQTTDDGFLLAGVTKFWTNDSDMWLVKTDAKGSVEWNQTYGWAKRDRASSVIQTADDGFLIVGTTESYGAGDYDIWLVKTYANGTIKWNQTFGGSERDYGSSVIQTADGGFLIIGSTESYGAGDYDIWLLKISETTDTTTESITETITEDETSPTNTISANSSESKDSSVLIPGFEIPSVIVIFLLGVIFYKRRKKI